MHCSEQAYPKYTGTDLYIAVTKYGFGKHIGTVSSYYDRAMFLKVC